jgi:DNA-3-methyladenine glycosylase
VSIHRPLPARFWERDPLEVAPQLLGRVVVKGGRAARIVEVEAYRGGDDPASHAHRGPTPRTEVMFGPAGRWYVYFTYGMHWCANVVCGREGTAAAVLLRAAAPLTGLDAMAEARGRPRRTRDLCSGPAKLCQALGIDGSDNATSVADGSVRIVDDGAALPTTVVQAERIGITEGRDLRWRWLVDGDPNVSVRPSPGVRR